MTAQDGLRYSDECVRHKILDALGDLSLVGRPTRQICILFRWTRANEPSLRESFKRGDIFISKDFSDGDRDNFRGLIYQRLIH